MKFNNVNVFISKNARLGKNVKVGDNTVIYENVVIGDDVTISNNCVIGEPTSEYYSDSCYSNKQTFIGSNSLIRSHTIIYAGCTIEEDFFTGHRVTIRENTKIGKKCRIGTLSDLQGHLEMGDYCWLHSNVHLGQGTKLGHFVFIYPFVVLTNDPTPPSNICKGVNVGNFSQIAVNSTVLPGINIGKHVLIGANSLVVKNIKDYILCAGNPAKEIKKVTEIKSRESGKIHYPWPYNFDRGMPWKGIGFDEWLKNNPKYD
ncbi:acyltransferase [Flavobacteriaceae bacterium 14752]|uniref:acyltransferase n=1 Tax=Mesohalobacter salilacus TaxID=2491711 RepID=UPI000F641103|nr:N-acetyltransferase [Flavobacteriaceae bacterium 14752]